MVEEFGLSDEELREAAEVIRRSKPGRYTLPKLYGQHWDAKVSPTTFGGRFKAAVTAGLVEGITIVPEKTGENHVQYELPAR